MPKHILSIEELRPWMQVSFSRSGGPGGQNVNKVSTRVALLFDLTACPLLSEAHKRRFRERFASSFDAEDRLRILCQTTRSQADNRARAEQKLLSMILATQSPPRPRIPTRPTAASRRRRLDDKKRRSTTLRQRRQNDSMV